MFFFCCFSAHECSGQLDVNGTFMYTDTHNFRSVATLLSCPSGYGVSMVTTTTCQANGRWSTPTPTCEGKWNLNDNAFWRVRLSANNVLAPRFQASGDAEIKTVPRHFARANQADRCITVLHCAQRLTPWLLDTRGCERKVECFSLFERYVTLPVGTWLIALDQSFRSHYNRLLRTSQSHYFVLRGKRNKLFR